MFASYHYSIDEVPCEFYYKVVPTLTILIQIKISLGEYFSLWTTIESRLAHLFYREYVVPLNYPFFISSFVSIRASSRIREGFGSSC
jgi:hypothetical protein